jgi:hypothetical protein
LSFYEGVGVGILKIEQSESEVLKIEESESELLYTNSTALSRTDGEPITSKFWNVYISTVIKQGSMFSQICGFCHNNASSGLGGACVQPHCYAFSYS